MASRPNRWSGALATHIGLCFAFLSMVFSIVLADRVADALFALTAVVSVAGFLPSVPKSRKRKPIYRQFD